LGYQNIGRLKVSVYPLLGVQVLQAFQYTPYQFLFLNIGKGSCLEQIGQVACHIKLHNSIVSLAYVSVIDTVTGFVLGYVAVVEAAGSFVLLHEVFTNFEGYPFVVLMVKSPHYLPIAALAQVHTWV
jgi:hypothetical protein